MNATPIYDQMQREAGTSRVNEALDTADAHTLRNKLSVMCA